MKIPFSWLKEYVDVTDEPERLGARLTDVGLALDGLERDGKDVVLDIDVTTNRVDCMNVYGLAREVALIYGSPLRPLALDFAEQGAPAASALKVEIEAPELCLRFCARVFDVTMGSSPQWLQDRLAQVGVRSISNVVDLTNYVMLELGQPSHAFDLERLPEARLVARWAREGEQLTTLDGQQRTLTARVGVVAGAQEALALAGVMGGLSSEIHGGTRVMALEAANWDPLSIRRASKRLGLHTEASHRFERGADYDAAPLGIARIGHLAAKLGALRARPGLIDVVGRPASRCTLALRSQRVDALLGVAVPAVETERILKGLGFEPQSSPAGWKIDVPGWRHDVLREIDVVEEVARHRGLASIPNTLPPANGAGTLAAQQKLERLVRRTLADLGFDEAINYVFVPETDWTVEQPAERMQNPLSAEQAVLRTSLIPGLVRNLQTSLRHGRRDVALFEIGRAYGPAGEPRRLALLMAGAWRERGLARAQAADLVDLQGALETLLQRLGLGPLDLLAEPQAPWQAWVGTHLHPHRFGHPSLDGQALGVLAELHPRAAEALDLKDRTLVAEIDLDALLGLVARRPIVRTRPLERFPSIERDLAVLWPKGKAAAGVLAATRSSGGAKLRTAVVVDRYDPKPDDPSGRVSLTVRLRFADAERTLEAALVDAAVADVVVALRALGAEIRGV